MSVLCLVLFPAADLLETGSVPGLSVLFMSEVGGVAILLMTPLPDEGARSGFVFAASLLALLVFCHFVGASPGLCAGVALLAVLLRLFLCFRFRYARVRALFRQQVVWYAMLSQVRLIYALMLACIGMAGVLASGHAWLTAVLDCMLAAMYVMPFVSSMRGRILLLNRAQEKSLRQMLSCGVRELRSPGQNDDAATMRILYEKVVSIMESGRPFLDEDYSLQDLSASVYTNKTYLSKTINIMSGKNFRQFINGYRILYSVDLMKKNPRLRVDELAAMSGFHSTVTYTMAFKANMNETPGEFCQRLRSNLV